MKSSFRRLLGAIFTFALVFTLFVPSRAAVSKFDLSANCSIKLLYTDARHLKDVRFSAYRVADVNESMSFSWTPAYEKYHLKLNMNEPQSLALMLTSYSLRDNLIPDAADSTNESGEICFEGLKTGMYLIVGESYTRDSYICTPIPTLIYFPYTGEDGHWSYTVDVEIKFEQDIDETVSIRALKVWNDGQSDNRLNSVQVELLRDGMTWDVVTLSAVNNWRYTWKNLERGHTWFVVEYNIPDGYTASIVRNGITFIVTNTLDEPEEPPTPPKQPPAETPEVPDSPKPDPEIPVVPPNVPPEEPTPQGPEPVIEEPAAPSEEKLPQTGLNWEPVIYLAAAGISCLALGLIFNKKGSKRP